jgi:hypothetical protein
MQFAQLTRHARARMQQRGIPAAALEALLAYGREAHDHHGGAIVYLDKAARARLAKAEPSAARNAASLARTYAVLGSDGKVVTVGHRYRRILRG